MNKQNKLLMTTTSTHNFWFKSLMKFLIILNQNLPILSVFITLLLRSYEGQLQPGEMKADSFPQIFHTLVLHHKVGFDQGGLLSSHLMTLWLGLSPMCADQVKNRHQCTKVALECTIKNMHWWCSHHLFWEILITEMFPSAIRCFYNYFSSC